MLHGNAIAKGGCIFSVYMSRTLIQIWGGKSGLDERYRYAQMSEINMAYIPEEGCCFLTTISTLDRWVCPP